jgi:hypothetical protein
METFCAIVKISFHFDRFKVYEIYPADLKLEEKLKKVAKRDGNFGEVKKVKKEIIKSLSIMLSQLISDVKIFCNLLSSNLHRV